ncbi:MAG: lytic transglycosylase domain-containing protein, partial [Candidatus Cryptobacteroides sp.]
MRHFDKYLIAALAAFSLIFSTVPSQAAGREKPKSKKELLRENYRLRAVLDSLASEVENARYRNKVADFAEAAEGEPASEELAPEDYTLDVTDSLLSIWYLHKKMQASSPQDFNMDSVHFESNVTDKEYLRRLAEMNSFITLPFNETVRNYIILYSEKMPAKMASMLALSHYYFPIFEEIFDKYGLPKELKYMAVIESAFNPVAVSRAGAKGMWQFMYNTAKMYGLTINSFVDERLDPVKSADAAARYLKDAYRIFGDWNLAISSYNCGSGNVNKAMRRSGSRDFWPVYEYLPRETRGYVPAFVGAMYAFTYSKEH